MFFPLPTMNDLPAPPPQDPARCIVVCGTSIIYSMGCPICGEQIAVSREEYMADMPPVCCDCEADVALI